MFTWRLNVSPESGTGSRLSCDSVEAILVYRPAPSLLLTPEAYFWEPGTSHRNYIQCETDLSHFYLTVLTLKLSASIVVIQIQILAASTVLSAHTCRERFDVRNGIER